MTRRDDLRESLRAEMCWTAAEMEALDDYLEARAYEERRRLMQYVDERLQRVSAPAPAAPADAPDAQLRRQVAECIPFMQRHNPQGALELADTIIALVRQHDAARNGEFAADLRRIAVSTGNPKAQEFAEQILVAAPGAQSDAEWLRKIERIIAGCTNVNLGHVQAAHEIDARYREREAERLRELREAAWVVVKRHDGRLGGSGDVILAEWKRLVNALAKVAKP